MASIYDPEALVVLEGNPSGMPADERRKRLRLATAQCVAAGWTVEFEADEMAVLVRGQRPNHVLHLLLSVVTLGLWLVVWAVLGITRREHRATLSVQEDGTVVSDVPIFFARR